jgi:hypothetical protein
MHRRRRPEGRASREREGEREGRSVGNAGVGEGDPILERVRADEAAADRARECYRRDGMPVLEPDQTILPHLLEGERLLAVHAPARLEYHSPRADDRSAAGTLYLTSERLIHLGTHAVAVHLLDIDEVGVTLDRLLLLTLDGGGGAVIEVDQPRLLRVQISTAAVEARIRMAGR